LREKEQVSQNRTDGSAVRSRERERALSASVRPLELRMHSLSPIKVIRGNDDTTITLLTIARC